MKPNHTARRQSLTEDRPVPARSSMLVMKTNPFSILSLTITASLLFLAPSAPAAPWQTLRGHVPAAVAQLQPTGRLSATNRLHLAVALAPRNRDGLEKLLRDLQDPHSPSYHQYLSLEEFTSRFGPTEQDYQKARDFARANGLKVSGTYSNRIILDMEGAVPDVEKALHVTIRTYQHPKEKREFYAPDTDPSLDLQVPLLNITGLDNYSLPHPVSYRKPVQPAPNGPTPNAFTGTNGWIAPADLRNAYVPGTTLTGAGQSVGLVEFGGVFRGAIDNSGGYYDSDLVAYESEFGLPAISVTTVPVDGGFVTAVGDNNGECSLDIEMVMAMAPGASIYVFESQDYYNDTLSTMVSYTFIKQFSTSWAFPTVAGLVGSSNPGGDVLLMEMAVQGQSFLAASGDKDAYSELNSDLLWQAETPYATVVGGTVLTMNGSGASYASETVWNIDQGNEEETGSSGGISPNYAIPYWQQGVSMTANLGSTTQRNFPDVAMVAQNLDIRYGDGLEHSASGTSAAAPLWAGFMALVNQQAARLGNPSAGFINPAIYALGEGTGNTPYASAFHDITTGNNFWILSPNNYPAVAGYDLCTGWGTPGIGLINALAGPYQSVVLNTNDSGPGSLRQAVSNSIAGAYAFSDITFATNLSGATIRLTSGTVSLKGNLTIDASALPSGITINGNQAGSVFFVTNGNVVLTALTITNGNASPSGYGGGILNYAVLTLNQCTLAGNSAGNAGGILNAFGTLVVNESTLTGNSGSYGGGILNLEGALTVNQSTLTGNSDPSGAAGGMYNWDQLGSVTLYNTIVAGNTLPNTSGYNGLTETTTSGITTQTGANLTNGTPLLAPLGNYGGPTPTMPPLHGSPAIDGCTNGTTFTADQRGYARSIGRAPDIGAVEGVYNSAGPGKLKNVTKLGNGSVSFTLTNYSDMSFTVLASTNVALPFGQWSNLGTAMESPPRLRPIFLYRLARDQLQPAILRRSFAVRAGSVLSVSGKTDVAGQADTLLQLCHQLFVRRVDFGIGWRP